MHTACEVQGSVTVATHMTSLGYVSLTLPLHTQNKAQSLGWYPRACRPPALVTSLAKESLSLDILHSYGLPCLSSYWSFCQECLISLTPSLQVRTLSLL